ncbi:MAG: HEPN domain-containing protein [Armatimonadota bacterium]|nr:HEPN domain-containing protein [Armatimonadota bacterium]
MSRASEALQEAHLLLENEHVEAAANRTYYAVFYAASALLEAQGIQAGRHSALIRLFGREFVSTGLMARRHGRTLSALFEQRQDADYVPAPTVAQERASVDLEEARVFVLDARELLMAELDERGSG